MRKMMLMILTGALLHTVACKTKDENNGKPTTEPAPTEASKEELRQRGEYLVTVMGCGDCHSPKNMTAKGPEPDMDRYLSGFNSTKPLPVFDFTVVQRDHVLLFNSDLTAAAGPWGVSFSANLTPDETGIGSWTLANFKTAITQGKSKGLAGARDLLPPMPWQTFKNLKDEDIEAIFTYLKSLKPVKNTVPNPLPPASAKR